MRSVVACHAAWRRGAGGTPPRRCARGEFCSSLKTPIFFFSNFGALLYSFVGIQSYGLGGASPSAMDHRPFCGSAIRRSRGSGRCATPHAHEASGIEPREAVACRQARRIAVGDVRASGRRGRGAARRGRGRDGTVRWPLSHSVWQTRNGARHGSCVGFAVIGVWRYSR